MPRRFAVCALALALSAAACGGFVDRQAATSTYKVLAASRDVAARQSDVELAREALPGGILQLATFEAAYPAEPRFGTLYADSLCTYAVAFVADDWEDAKLAGRAADQDRLASRLRGLLASCVAANLAHLAPGFARARAAGPSAQLAQLASARAGDVAALRWIATADALAIALDPLRHFAELPAVAGALAACAKLEPGGDGARAELLLGTLAAARSQLAGGDDGSAQFDAARKLAGESALIVDVMFARSVAVAHHDRAAFEAALHRALDADLARWPDHRLDNELALRKARRYLAAEAVLLP